MDLTTRARTLASGALALVAAMLLAAAPPARAATITIVNKDGAGEGFSDPTPAAPVGGNPGTTIGQQRLNVFQRAAEIWGGILPSPVAILVDAYFNPLACDATSGVLGSAGPVTIHANFAGAEFTNFWYHQALANKERGVDNTATYSDIQATFSSTLGDPGCLGGTPWYYGLDHNHGAGIDLLAVVLHELAHGLGFSTTTSVSTGAYAGTTPLPGLWDRFLLNRATGLHWNQMSAAQRVASAISTGNLVWDGKAVTFMAPFTLTNAAQVLVNAPAGIAGSYAAGVASFGAPISLAGVTSSVVLSNDGGGVSTSDACGPLTNAAQVSGHIAFVDRGNCSFSQKALNVQNAGAVGLLVANNTSGTVDMVGSDPVNDPNIILPILSVSQADGNTIRGQLGVGVNATLGLNPGRLSGASPEGRAQMYAPNPVEGGSSVSHFDVSARPNLLMEPVINGDLGDNVDLTRYLFEDLGWVPRTTAVAPAPITPALALRSAPNPFRAETQLRVDLAGAGVVDLTVFDLAGRPVRHLLSSWQPAGPLTVSWDGTDLSGSGVPAGVYLTRLRTAAGAVTMRVVRIE